MILKFHKPLMLLSSAPPPCRVTGFLGDRLWMLDAGIRRQLRQEIWILGKAGKDLFTREKDEDEETSS